MWRAWVLATPLYTPVLFYILCVPLAAISKAAVLHLYFHSSTFSALQSSFTTHQPHIIQKVYHAFHLSLRLKYWWVRLCYLTLVLLPQLHDKFEQLKRMHQEEKRKVEEKRRDLEEEMNAFNRRKMAAETLSLSQPLKKDKDKKKWVLPLFTLIHTYAVTSSLVRKTVDKDLRI